MWYGICRKLGDIKNVEVFFPGSYTNETYEYRPLKNGWNYVQDPTCCNPPLFNGEGTRTTFPIEKLIHITHIQQASEIISKGEETLYTFEANPKNGKVYDYDYEGSYRKVKTGLFQKVQSDESVICGKLSWWSPEIASCYISEGSDKYRKSVWRATRRLRSRRIFLAPYLSNPRESPYGNKGYAVSFKDLLRCYLQSRKDVDDDRVVTLRVGGTLRYRYEICYVVIICTNHDHDLKRLYPSLSSSSDLFDHKGMVQKNGQVKDIFFTSQQTIDFKPQYIIKCTPKRNYSDYETPAFAFYYPKDSDSSSMVCTESLVTESSLDHKCTRLCKKKITTT